MILHKYTVDASYITFVVLPAIFNGGYFQINITTLQICGTFILTFTEAL